MFERIGAVADKICVVDCTGRGRLSEIDSAVLVLVLQEQLHGQFGELQYRGEGDPHWWQLFAPRSIVAVLG